MALKLNERYPGRFNNPTTSYPQGSFKNRTAPNAQDGSYLEQDWANDILGFLGRLITVSGVTLDGNVDTALSSQYYDALRTLTLQRSNPFGDIASDGSTALTTARTNLGLGNAAQRNVGTTSGTVAAGNDSRFGQMLGVGQSWVSVSRSLDVTYTNSTGKPIFIAVHLRTLSSAPSAVAGVLTTGDVQISFSGGGMSTTGAYKSAMLYAPIPDRTTYSLSSVTVDAVIAGWWELR